MTGGACLEVRFRDKVMTMAVMQRRKHKYAGLESNKTEKHADVKESGLLTLCFTNSKRKRCMAALEKFEIYSELFPVICKGLGADQVWVTYTMRATGLSSAVVQKGERPINAGDDAK